MKLDITSYLLGKKAGGGSGGGSIEPEGEVTMVYENYTPNGATFKTTVDDIDFASGDYIEAEIDISSCVGTNENILTFGQNISAWTGSLNIHCYATYSSKTVQIIPVNSSKYSTAVITVPSNICVIKLNKNGVYLNGELLIAKQFNRAQGANEDPTGATYTSVMEVIPTLTSINVGSEEGPARSNATYNYIKVVRMNKSES